MKENEFEIHLFDVTMLEANGIFKKVKEIMASEFPYPEKWTISSRLIIVSNSGMADMNLDFNQDGNIYIIDYNASNKSDIYLNKDLTSLSYWAQKSGWKVPSPVPFLVKNNLSFWMHWWRSAIVDSEYLEDLYGKRDHVKRDNKDD